MEGISPERYKELYGYKPKKYLGQPSESVEQISLFQWASFQSAKYPELELMYHIPNEGKRSKAQGGKLKAEGLKAGVPDICLPCPKGRFHGLYIEMKVKGNKPTEKQNEWLGKLSLQGHATAVCYSWEEASNVILNYLKGAG